MADGAGILEEAKKIPWWGWLGGGVAVFLVAKHLIGNSATSTGTTAADTSGVDTSGGSTGDIGVPGPTAQGTTGSVGSPTGTTPTSTTGTTGQTTSSGKTYVVQSGDTLNGIASRQHVDEPALYSMNAGTLESTAQAHGFGSSDHGHWIFPGEVLKIPA